MDYKQKIERAFNSFTGKNLDSLNSFYASDVVFIDPVLEVRGLGRLKAYYSHAYENVKSIRFEFTDTIQEGSKVGASWIMHLQVTRLNGGKEYQVPGFSLFKFNEDGLVIFHRDYVDLGAMIYERLPLQGQIIRGIKSLLKRGGSAAG
ncbi:MAG TPA: nuclear transport factor 2 family protein [Bdellovibrio sp.]